MSGLARYYDPTRVNSTVYYALKHREGNILVALSGPTDKLRQARSLLDGRHLLDRPGSGLRRPPRMATAECSPVFLRSRSRLVAEPVGTIRYRIRSR